MQSSPFTAPALSPIRLYLSGLLCIRQGFVEVFERGVGA